MKAKPMSMPVFRNESEEADWWASKEGRAFLKQKSAVSQRTKKKSEGSPLVTRLNKTNSVQIALRLPEADLTQARKIATRRGVGYQTLLKMLVHEGLQREARRQ